MEAPPPQHHLLTLPPEIREHIYRLILHPHANRRLEADDYTVYSYSAALVLFRLNRQIYIESRKIFYDLNTFVRAETPWPQAKDHIQLEGHMPIVATGAKAARFKNHRMVVSIDAPEYALLGVDLECFIVMAEDLELFAKTWYYADLSYPSLNSNLRLTLKLNDPFTPEWEEKRMTKALQKQLLLPWSKVKNLAEFRIMGDPKPYDSVEKELKAAQAEPHNSPEYCLSEGTRFKQEGNTELQAGRYREALELYTKAWEAIHITIRGRIRQVHADAFFGLTLTQPPYEHKHGQQERLILRVQLVANTCLAFLKLNEFDECRFWGMRTINTIREAMGADEHMDLAPEQEAVTGFPAANEMGKIYWRTGLAWKAMDEKTEARRLLRVAKVYLRSEKDQKALDEALKGCMLMI